MDMSLFIFPINIHSFRDDSELFPIIPRRNQNKNMFSTRPSAARQTDRPEGRGDGGGPMPVLRQDNPFDLEGIRFARANDYLAGTYYCRTTRW
jgi:hypothetical protein